MRYWSLGSRPRFSLPEQRCWRRLAAPLTLGLEGSPEYLWEQRLVGQPAIGEQHDALWIVHPGAGTEQQPHGQVGCACLQRVLHDELRSRVDDRGLPARLIFAPYEPVPLIGFQAGHVQVPGQVVVNTRDVSTGDARQTGDSSAVGESQLSGLFEAVSARYILPHALYPIMGELHIPQGRTFQLTELSSTGGAAEQPA